MYKSTILITALGSLFSLASALTGDGTYYHQNGIPGSCGVVHSDSDLIGAIHVPSCNSCALVKGPLGSVLVKLVDTCPGCVGDDIDLSVAAFQQIATLDMGRVKVTYDIVACDGSSSSGSSGTSASGAASSGDSTAIVNTSGDPAAGTTGSGTANSSGSTSKGAPGSDSGRKTSTSSTGDNSNTGSLPEDNASGAASLRSVTSVVGLSFFVSITYLMRLI